MHITDHPSGLTIRCKSLRKHPAVPMSRMVRRDDPRQGNAASTSDANISYYRRPSLTFCGLDEARTVGQEIRLLSKRLRRTNQRRARRMTRLQPDAGLATGTKRGRGETLLGPNATRLERGAPRGIIHMESRKSFPVPRRIDLALSIFPYAGA